MNASTKTAQKTAQKSEAPAADTASKPRVLEDISKPQAERNIRPLAQGEKPTVKAVVNGSTVEYHFEVGGTAAIKKPHQVVSVLDFSECTQEEILQLACKPVVIALQRRWNTLADGGKAIDKATEPGTFATVNVKTDIVDSQRHSAPTSAKANKLIDKLSADEKADLIKRLQAEMDADS